MDLGNGWGLNETLLRKLRLLEYFADKSRGSTIPRLPEWASQPGSKERADAISDLEDFDARGWLRNFMRISSGGANAQVVGPGFAYVEEVRERRGDKLLRAKAARDALLHWLRELELDTDAAPDLEDIFGTRFGLFYGEPFTQREIDLASRYLYDQGYIIGITVEESVAILKPSIQAKGIEAVDSNLSVNDKHTIPTPSIITTTTTITGNSNVVQAGSPGGSQNATLTTEQSADVAELVMRLRLLEGPMSHQQVPGPGAKAVADEVEALIARNEPGAFRQAILMAQGAGMSVIGTDGGKYVTQLAHHILTWLG